MYTNRYIFIYASVMVIIVATILSSASIILKPFQQKNIKVEKMRNILASVNIESTVDNAEDLYKKSIIEERVIDINGNIISIFKDGKLLKGETKAFDVNMKIELKNIEKYKIDNKSIMPKLPLFICNNNNSTYYIIPVMGKGLWGPIWGNIALKNDLNTIAGATFAHKGETPGLGSEIDTKDFQSQFLDKKIFDSKGNLVSIKVIKGGVINSKTPIIHGVDAISGGTITSDAVTDMLKDCLNNYENYLKKLLVPDNDQIIDTLSVKENTLSNSQFL